MSVQQADLDQLKSGTAVLATCIVQTLSESDPSFQMRFLEKLEQAYAQLRDDPVRGDLNTLSLLSWTRELLTGFSFAGGQGEPFLHGR